MDIGIAAQQEFLASKGMYQGVIDGHWGPMSRNAMMGWACVCNSGHLDGSPMDGRKPNPQGYAMIAGVLTKLDEVEALEDDTASVVAQIDAELDADDEQPTTGLSSITVPNESFEEAPKDTPPIDTQPKAAPLVMNLRPVPNNFAVTQNHGK